MSADITVVEIDSDIEESDRKRKKLKRKYRDLKTAFDMMQKRMQDRIDRLKDANDAHTADKAAVDMELAAIAKQYRDLKGKIESTSIGGAKVFHLENLIRQKDQDFAICKHDLRTYRKENQVLHDMASDAQNYAILIERLLKGVKSSPVIWPNRPFEISLTGIKE